METSVIKVAIKPFKGDLDVTIKINHDDQIIYIDNISKYGRIIPKFIKNEINIKYPGYDVHGVQA
jgi:hypothetical protein